MKSDFEAILFIVFVLCVCCKKPNVSAECGVPMLLLSCVYCGMTNTAVDVLFDGTDEVKNTEEPGTEADLLKVEVVDEVKASEVEERDKSGEKADTSAVDEEHEKTDEPGRELSVDVDKDSK